MPLQEKIQKILRVVKSQAEIIKMGKSAQNMKISLSKRLKYLKKNSVKKQKNLRLSRHKCAHSHQKLTAISDHR